MTRNELIQQVALRMDEVSPDITIADLTVDGADGNPLYALIDGLVDAGALELFSTAPYWRLPQTEFGATNTIVGALPTLFGGRKIIRLKILDDFLRVAEISCKDFQRPITEVVPEMSEAGKRQHNRFLMGKEARPVGVMSHGLWGADKCREIDCYSLSGTSTVTASDGIEAFYIATPTMPEAADATTQIESVIPPVLVDALEWIIASRTFGARGDAEHAAICQQYAQNLLV